LAHNQTSARLDLNVQTAVHSGILLCSLPRSAKQSILLCRNFLPLPFP
jgi:hypothetical protein